MKSEDGKATHSEDGRDWPDNGDYWHRACRDCGHKFNGPKRAPCCWSCKAARDSAQPVEDGLDWRNHSAQFARGERCPQTIETAQAAWDRDQELIFDQKSEISRLKETVNDLRQKISSQPARQVVGDEREATAYLIKLAARLARREPLTRLHLICEQQQQITTRKLAAHVDLIGDVLTDFACEMRRIADNINSRAKPARQVGDDWPKLDKPAKVGGGRFSVGVSARLVVEAAQRQYEYDVTPEKEAERIAKATDFLGSLQGARQVGGDEPVAVVDCSDNGCWADILDDVTVKVGQKLYAHPAALAPAAVAVVLPEPVAWGRWAEGLPAGTRLMRYDGNPHVTCDRNEYHTIPLVLADEVARLNRRAIPLELLGRIAKPTETLYDREQRADALEELRALLGKEGDA